ncbi:FHA domain-containing protein [Ramlibacter alkalitolerans]|uniref:FHA domain-containing protein n=1 Tax=Ramlibacter alkalitolerans TaxID=2039631 RepID=A0ABS1JYE6_9BURK|nr:FHA domain-containing protein [Ramlibacter alkalitolerans]MBL0428400.1 FHA domain-containing protein [Ramlibacter alkalitolerans]
MPQLIASVKGVEVKHVFLHKDRTTLGRKAGNDIVLDTMVVSGNHCAFELVGVADVFLQDLGSTNGTYVNDRMVKERTRLHDGDVIAIGPYRIKYLQASEEPTTAFGGTHMGSIDPPQLQASFSVMNGSSAGLEMPVVKAVTTFGKPNVCVVSVAHRRGGFFVTHLAGSTAPMLNGSTFGADPLQLADADVLELAGTQMRFQLRE